MYIESIVLENFRNYGLEKFEFSPERNVIFGDNAQGKTNLLEAICLLSAARSFRGARESELMRAGTAFARVEGQVVTSERSMSLKAEFAAGSRRKLFSNGVKMRTAGEFAGRLRTVLFCPDDLMLVRAGASERRRFMDMAISQLRPRYADSISKYSRLHEQKTRLLRDYREDPALGDMLEAFNIQLCQVGAAVIRYRAQFCRGIAGHAAAIHSEISGGRETLGVRYKTVSTVTDPFASEREIAQAIYEHMQSHRTAELASGQALSGPHKDDIEIRLCDRPARSFASQGQQRSIALAMKLAEGEISRELTGESPVLALDDVLSELDAKRREYITGGFAERQVFLTACGDLPESILPGAAKFIIRGGNIERTV